MDADLLRSQPVRIVNGPFITKQELDMRLSELELRLDKMGRTCEANHPASVFSGGTTESKWVETTIMAVREELSSLRKELLEITYDFNEFKNMIIEDEIEEEPAAKEAKTEAVTEEISSAQEMPSALEDDYYKI